MKLDAAVSTPVSEASIEQLLRIQESKGGSRIDNAQRWK